MLTGNHMQLTMEEFYELMERLKHLEERVTLLEQKNKNNNPTDYGASHSDVLTPSRKNRECSKTRPYKVDGLKNGLAYCTRRELIIKVVFDYCSKHEIESSDQFESIFPKELQYDEQSTKIGTYVTDDDMRCHNKYKYSDKENSSSFDKYFFSRPYERVLAKNGDIIYITKEWSVDAINSFVANATRLGYKITKEE